MKNTSILIPIVLICCLVTIGFLFYKAMQVDQENRARSSNAIVLNQEDYNNEDDVPADLGESSDYGATTEDNSEADASANSGQSSDYGTNNGDASSDYDATAGNESSTSGDGTNDGFRELTPAEREEARRQSRLDEEREAAEAEAARQREATLDAEAAEAARAERTRQAQAANATSSSYGRYLVIAGSFRQKANAEQRVKDLRNAGFSDTQLKKFNRGTYAVALAGQTDRFSAAERLASQIVGAGFEAKVMRRR